MMIAVKPLLKLMGIATFPGATFGFDAYDRREFCGRYREAFEHGKNPRVTIAIGGTPEKIIIAPDIDRLWNNLSLFRGRRISVVLRIPLRFWSSITPSIEPHLILDLTQPDVA